VPLWALIDRLGLIRAMCVRLTRNPGAHTQRTAYLRSSSDLGAEWEQAEWESAGPVPRPGVAFSHLGLISVHGRRSDGRAMSSI
jgi:hypothetical protein